LQTPEKKENKINKFFISMFEICSPYNNKKNEKEEKKNEK
jgi:hypothetical protein